MRLGILSTSLTKSWIVWNDNSPHDLWRPAGVNYRATKARKILQELDMTQQRMYKTLNGSGSEYFFVNFDLFFGRNKKDLRVSFPP